MTSTMTRTRIEASPEGPGITLVEFTGDTGGPTLVILGGVHGDEPQGVAATTGLVERIAGLDLSGTVRMVPVSHEAAFGAATRTSPLDGRNLAREFPGDTAGAPTQRLAALLDEAVIDAADILIDLHSAGLYFAMPPLVGFCDDGSETSRTAARLAEAAAAPLIWRHPGPPAAGRTGTAPHLRGVPFLYMESTDGIDDPSTYVDAVLRVMVAAGLLPATAVGAPAEATDGPLRLFGSGDLDHGGVLAPVTGLIEMLVALLDPVRAGETVATMTDPRSGAIEPVVAPLDGVVVMHRRTTSAAQGDMVVFLTQPDEGA